MIHVFSLQEFQQALSNITDNYGCWNNSHLGVRQGNHAFLVGFGNPFCQIMLYSSVAHTGVCRADGKDSIRAWLVAPDLSPVGGKTQKWVTRKPGWHERLEDMLVKISNLGRWIQPCPKCKQLLALKVSGDKTFVFCPQDAQRKTDKNHIRHLPFLVLDTETGDRSET